MISQKGKEGGRRSMAIKGRQKDSWIDRQINKQTDKQIDRQRDIQINLQMYR